MMAEDDYTDSSSSSTPKKKGTVFGLPYWEVGIIAIVGVVVAIYIKDHFLSGSSSPTYTLASNGTSPAITSSGGSTSSGASTSTSPSSSIATWVQDAMNFATSIGMNQSTVNSALENYTAGNTITSSPEATAIHSIINAIGAAPGLGDPTVKIGDGTTSAKKSTPPSTGTGTGTGTGTPPYTPPATQQPSTPATSSDYLFSAPGTNNGVTTVAQQGTSVMQGSGYNASTNPSYLAISNPNQADMARARGALLFYQPSPDVFDSAEGVNLAPGTTLFAET